LGRRNIAAKGTYNFEVARLMITQRRVLVSAAIACILLLTLYVISVRATERAEFCRKALAGEHKLISMDSPDHPPGQYDIEFEKPELLKCLSSAQVRSLQPLPGVLPFSREDDRRLAIALAQSIGATVKDFVWFDTSPPAFLIQHATNQGVRRLARDPRVRNVGPNLYVHEQKRM
jgi:hypothetical protein